jgi:hypothetical protein
MAVLKSNTKINLDIIINPGPAPLGGASLGAGLDTERRFIWSSSTADMALYLDSEVSATYNLPNLTAGPSPSTKLDTLIGYSNYAVAGYGSLLYGGPRATGRNVAPIALPSGSSGQVLKMVSGTSGPALPGWATPPSPSLSVGTWSKAIAGPQSITSGVGYYVPAGVSATFNLPESTPNTVVAVYSSASGASWSIILNGQTIQFGNVTAVNSINSAQDGDGIWMVSTDNGNWFVAFAAGNPSFT